MKNGDLVEGRATQRFYSSLVGNKKRGDTFRMTVAHAQHLIGLGVIELINTKPAGPSEIKPAGPNETKQGDAAAKKSSGAPRAGLLTGSALSSAPGTAIRSLFSAADRVLQRATAFAGSRVGSTVKAIRLRS